MYESYIDKQKDNFTLMAHSIASGVSHVLNGTPIKLFEENNTNTSANENEDIDVNIKHEQLNSLKEQFS